MTTAEPEVQTSTTGLWVRLASPSAKKPAVRSSRIETASNLGLRSAATVNGVDREPGEITIVSTPRRARTSIVNAPHTELTLERASASKGLEFWSVTRSLVKVTVC